MGQLITVIEKPSARHGFVRFETNRAITGMGHERYSSINDVCEDRPPDVLARLLFETGRIESLHMYGNIITAELKNGATTVGMTTIIEDLFIHYKPGVLPSLPSA
jgi:hypothetical protein